MGHVPWRLAPHCLPPSWLRPPGRCTKSYRRWTQPAGISSQLRTVIDRHGRKVGREVHRGVVSSGNRGFPRHKQAEEATSLSSVGAVQGGEPRQGLRQGELPASPTASLKRSL